MQHVYRIAKLDAQTFAAARGAALWSGVPSELGQLFEPRVTESGREVDPFVAASNRVLQMARKYAGDTGDANALAALKAMGPGAIRKVVERDGLAAAFVGEAVFVIERGEHFALTPQDHGKVARANARVAIAMRSEHVKAERSLKAGARHMAKLEAGAMLELEAGVVEAEVAA